MRRKPGSILELHSLAQAYNSGDYALLDTHLELAYTGLNMTEARS